VRLFVDISAHGLGHLAQTAPILSALRSRIGALHLVVRSGLDEGVLRRWLGPDIHHIPSETDFGVVMASPFVVDRPRTLGRYQACHARSERIVDEMAAVIRREGCEAVLSNVGYFALAAACRAGVPAAACSSLNWRDIFAAYCADLPGAAPILAEMEKAYASADLFLRLVPGLPMARFATQVVSRPIARVGVRRREAIAAALGAGAEQPIVLCAFGGMLPPVPPPFVADGAFAVIGPDLWASSGLAPLSALDIPFPDLIASADLVVSKPGYGIVAELACAGTHSILISRNDWPEEPYLIRWLAERTRCTVVTDVLALDDACVAELVATPVERSDPALEAGGEHFVAERLEALVRG